jgi:hypothetical protein
MFIMVLYCNKSAFLHVCYLICSTQSYDECNKNLLKTCSKLLILLLGSPEIEKKKAYRFFIRKPHGYMMIWDKIEG